MLPLGPITSSSGTRPLALSSSATFGASLYGSSLYGSGGSLSYGGTTYSAAQVAAMLVSPSLQLRWSFDLLGPDLRFKQDLTPSVDMANPAVIDHDSSRAVKRQLTINFWRPVLGVDTFNDIIRARVQILAPDGGWLEWRIGHFRFVPPNKLIAETASAWNLIAPDLSQSLVGASFTESFGVPAGVSLPSAISLIAGSYGGQLRWRIAIIDNGTTLATPLSWNAGTSRIAAINALCAAFNYTPVWVDGVVLRSRPIPDYNATPAAYSFDATKGMSAALSPIQEVPDYTNAYNQFRVTGQHPAQVTSKTVISAFYENDNPASPISTRRSEPRMAPEIQDSAIPDNATAAARAQAEAAKAARIFAAIQLPFLPWWFGQDLDVYRLVISSADEGVVARNYLNLKWTHPCTVQTPTTMVLQRVVAS